MYYRKNHLPQGNKWNLAPHPVSVIPASIPFHTYPVLLPPSFPASITSCAIKSRGQVSCRAQHQAPPVQPVYLCAACWPHLKNRKAHVNILGTAQAYRKKGTKKSSHHLGAVAGMRYSMAYPTSEQWNLNFAVSLRTKVIWSFLQEWAIPKSSMGACTA